MRALLVALLLLGSFVVLAPTASACVTPAGGGNGCGLPGPVSVCLGAAIDSGCRADIVCVSQTALAAAPGNVCIENRPM